MDINAQYPTQITISPVPPASGTGGFFSGNGPTFQDAMDTINPLEHIPVVSAIYDTIRHGHNKPDISPAAELAGGALFGGVFGLVGGLANVIFKSATGHSIGTAISDAITGNTSPTVKMAAADPSVHLGDFAGDVMRMVRGDTAAQATTVASAEAPQAVAPQQTAMAGSDADDKAITTVADAAPVMAVSQDAIQSVKNATQTIAPTGKDAQVLSLFDSAGYNAYQKSNTAQNTAALNTSTLNQIM